MGEIGETVRRKVVYFDGVGSRNTGSVVKAVKERVGEGDVSHVIVASVSGETALKVARALAESKVKVVCVSGFAGWLEMRGVKHPFVKAEARKKLEALGVSIVDNVSSSFSDTVDYSLARYGYVPASWFVIETLIAMGGYGLKTAVEAVLMATDCGAVPPFSQVVSVAGTDRGADTAIVARSTFSSFMFSGNSEWRFQVHEILAMPRNKKWYKNVAVGGVVVEEVQKGEGLNW